MSTPNSDSLFVCSYVFYIAAFILGVLLLGLEGYNTYQKWSTFIPTSEEEDLLRKYKIILPMPKLVWLFTLLAMLFGLINYTLDMSARSYHPGGSSPNAGYSTCLHLVQVQLLVYGFGRASMYLVLILRLKAVFKDSVHALSDLSFYLLISIALVFTILIVSVISASADASVKVFLFTETDVWSAEICIRIMLCDVQKDKHNWLCSSKYEVVGVILVALNDVALTLCPIISCTARFGPLGKKKEFLKLALKTSVLAILACVSMFVALFTVAFTPLKFFSDIALITNQICLILMSNKYDWVFFQYCFCCILSPLMVRLEVQHKMNMDVKRNTVITPTSEKQPKEILQTINESEQQKTSQ
ncbi:hypothetical protein RFI_10298 [Reticulomyxa filosa]|uniref:Uncharacterized protein n=1 Tax=Reticulomyxa filosa TaxID=46433 RepID=X6NN66_RETFI|nr:hypothetical protein RFI_10298 [Reticulomyxa filosa]|eukprot:ETO26837.1 hypothetical protein RFI_10298 [Reticulomyxa filosa]